MDERLNDAGDDRMDRRRLMPSGPALTPPAGAASALAGRSGHDGHAPQTTSGGLPIGRAWADRDAADAAERARRRNG
ncbi:hypothetical protein GCM10011505_35700 [Tistrella bauzanensis]|uniref:Uncharacterized protein n=1 Tax=Tistrella bauzanensis TaxID=657419 RepID=A0ABQ1IUI5_9PROT|nr:hypothetical protein [Tistrella bauzanensis]GGB51497.1 hypothetical protein GCM10011505_35700 [Tistrella bauzanensis]